MEVAFKKEKVAVNYVFPDYADQPWPADYVHKKKNIKYPWLNR